MFYIILFNYNVCRLRAREVNYLVHDHIARQSWNSNPRVPVSKPCAKGILCRENCIFKGIWKLLQLLRALRRSV